MLNKWVGNVFCLSVRGLRKSTPKKVRKKAGVKESGAGRSYLKPSALLRDPKLIDQHYRDLIELRNKQMREYFPKKDDVAKPTVKEQVDIQLVIRAYQYRGHMVSRIDPLEIIRKKPVRPEFPSPMVLRQHRIPVKRQKLYMLPKNTSIGDGSHNLLLETIIQKLETVYCGSMGLEYMYVPSRRVKFWLREKFERARNTHISQNEERKILKKLIEVEEFDKFVLEKCPQDIKYSIAGCEMLIPGLIAYMNTAADTSTFLIGMPRMGRLAILTHLMNKPLVQVFNTFTHGNKIGASKYELGGEVISPSTSKPEAKVKICLVGIAGATEGYVPVTLGAAKSLMQKKTKHDIQRTTSVCPIIIHTPQSIQSEAVNYDAMTLRQTEEFQVNGALHIVMNNEFQEQMVGDKKLVDYCTDVGKCVNAPIIHVNAHDVLAVIQVMEMAAEYRQNFLKDIYVDLVGYQKVQKRPMELIKHSEIEKQKIVDVMPSIAQKLAQNLIERKAVTKEEVETWRSQYENTLYTNYVLSEERYKSFVASFWEECISSASLEKADRDRTEQTDISNKKLRRMVSLDPLYFQKLAQVMSEEPSHFKVTMSLAHLFQQREFKVKHNHLGWYAAESLAFITLLQEGLKIRLSGREVNKRYHILSEDKVNGKKLNFLNHKFDTEGFTVAESVSSPEATLGYEVGFSLNNHEYLVIWEADEGDTIPHVQHYIDNYLVSPPYGRESSIVLLCPHGYVREPFSISNGRPERFLQLLNLTEAEAINPSQYEKTNMIVTCITTPSNYFHVLRRQASLPDKRPLLLFGPKFDQANSQDWLSPFEDLIDVFQFQAYKRDESIESHSMVKKHILCTGQIYYDLVKARNALGLNKEIALTRLEQICPFPFEQVLDDIYMHPEASLCWVQSEPQNQGWWTYLEPRLKFILYVFHVSMKLQIEFITRPASEVPDSSSEFEFERELQQVIHDALQLPDNKS